MIRSGFLAAVMALAVSIPLAAATTEAEAQVVFGPEVFGLLSWGRATKTINFSLNPPAEAPFLLDLSSVGRKKVDSIGRSKVILNGVQIFGPGDSLPFTQLVDLQESGNTLEVELSSDQDLTVAVTIVGYRYILGGEYPSKPSGWDPLLAGTPGNTPLDWQTQGAVTPVKNQGACQADWAFSATGSIEGALKLKVGSLFSLSEQQLIDCAGVPAACSNGGSPVSGLDYAIANGVTTEAAYPFTARTGTCNVNGGADHISGFVLSTPGDETALKTLLTEGPVSVVLNGNWYSNYTSGIADPCHGTEPPIYASALIVGYGYAPTTGAPYWIVKNSLGTSWGESGYFRLAAGQDQCGIADYAVLPTE
jgi:cathepsin L